MILYGIHSVGARLRHQPQSVARLILQQSSASSPENLNRRLTVLVDVARQYAIHIEFVTKDRLDQICKQGNHQGIAAIAERLTPTYLSLDDFLDDHQEGALQIIALDQINDPHNLGAILRNADAFGVRAVIIPKDRSAGLSETVARVAVGAAESVPLIVVNNFARALKSIANAQVMIAGLASSAPSALWDYRPHHRQCWVLGSEAEGLRRLTQEHCDTLLTIPMQGIVDSINVAACSAVCLAHYAQSFWKIDKR